MRTRLFTLLLLTLSIASIAPAAFANQAAIGFCETGGKHVSLSGLTSTTFVQQSYPTCTVTVRLVSNGSLATIFADNASTPLSNPFTADSGGFWKFYAANNRYNVSLTNAGISGTILVPDILLNDPSGGGGSVTSVFGRTGTVIAQSGDYDCTLVTNAACLASPAFTGVPTAPTATPGTNTTQLATTAFVTAAIPSAVVSSVFTRTGAITAQTGDYTVAQVTGAAPLLSPTFTGVPLAPTAAPSTNTTQIATTAFVTAAIGSSISPVTSVFGRVGVITALNGDYDVSLVTGAAPLNSPALIGTPTAPTPSLGDNSTVIPTTAWVKGQNYLTSVPSPSGGANRVPYFDGLSAFSDDITLTFVIGTGQAILQLGSTTSLNGTGVLDLCNITANDCVSIQSGNTGLGGGTFIVPSTPGGGTFAVTATAPLAIDAATGNLSIPTGFSGTKVAGACTFTISNGIITNVAGC